MLRAPTYLCFKFFYKYIIFRNIFFKYKYSGRIMARRIRISECVKDKISVFCSESVSNNKNYSIFCFESVYLFLFTVQFGTRYDKNSTNPDLFASQLMRTEIRVTKWSGGGEGVWILFT